jgi:hypothetical protein
MPEKPARLQGWTRIIEPGKGSIYRAPDGSVVGQWVYAKAFDHYRHTGVVLQTPPGDKWRQVRRPSSSKSTEKQEHFEELVAEIPVGDDGDSIYLDLPEKEPSKKAPRAGLFSAKEMTQGIGVLLTIATTLIAMATSLPEAQMTEQEVRAISIPLASIIERSKYNRVVGMFVVDKSDWMTLGYVLYLYIDRVATAARLRRESGTQQSVRPAAQAPAAAGNNGAGTIIGTGLPLRPAQAGLRNITSGP